MKSIFSLRKYLSLTISLAKRDVLGRYKGTLGGLLWSAINPLIMLILYTSVFGYVFKTKWSSGNGSELEYSVILFLGLIVFNIFSECIVRAPRLVIDNANYVKKVVFPLEILPIVNLISAVFHMLVSFMIWFVFYIVTIGLPKATILLLPFAILPGLLSVSGLTWVLSALGVYARDLNQFTSTLITVMMFSAPLFYPLDVIPKNLRWIADLNPATSSITYVRDIAYWGLLPDGVEYVLSLSVGTLICVAGYLIFIKLKKGFADVL